MIVYTVIVTYNGLKNDWIKKSLQSLSTSTHKSNVIIVDNSSTDATVLFIENSHPECIIIKNKKNVGFGKANNQGIEQALQNGADYVFLLNQDAYVQHNTIEKLVKIAANNTSFGIISPIHLNGFGTHIETDFLSFASTTTSNSFINDALLGKLHDKIYETKFINAAAWLVSKACFQSVGGFSPSFYHYGEDNNFCHRAQFHKIKIGIYPQSFILHDRDAMPAEHADLSERMFKDQLVSWANPNLNTFNNPSSIRLIISFLYASLFTQNKNVIKASKKLIKFRLLNSKNFINNLVESKTDHPFKFLNFEQAINNSLLPQKNSNTN